MTAETAERVFVLVHGAFHGGWCWARVRRLLERAGHSVHSPSQTGLGDRRHLLSDQITLDTFVEDIVATIETEELEDVTLVGHSFGGRVICGVADRLPGRLGHLVFLDGAIPLNSASRLESMSESERAERIEKAQAFDGGLSVPPPPAERFGLTAHDDIAWVTRRLTPQPLSVEASRLELTAAPGNGVPTTFLHCVAPSFHVVEPSVRYAKTRSDWTYRQVQASHDAMITHPGLVAEELLRLTARVGVQFSADEPERVNGDLR